MNLLNERLEESCEDTISVPDLTAYEDARSFAVTRWRRGQCTAGIESLAEEVPVALVFNGISHVVMLATPSDLADFGLGFGLSEGILRTPRDLYSVDIVGADHGLEVRLLIAGDRMQALRERRRNLAGRTGCGLCGIESLREAMRPPPLVAQGCAVASSAIHRAMNALTVHQTLYRATGAAHAAAWVSQDGEVVLVREDVGRHNALDKLIGAMARREIDPQAGFLVITSRASYEMVQKAASAGVGLMAAISAPTGMAVRVAQAAGLSLLALVSDDRHIVYTHPWRVHHGDEPCG